MKQPVNQNAFDTQWWNTFLAETKYLKCTNVFSESISMAETSNMRNDVMTIIKLICKNKLVDFGFRLFIEGKNVSGSDLKFFFEKLTPETEESFEDWSVRAFGSKKFGIILNRGEKFSPILVEKISRKIKPLIKDVGIPRLGVTFTIFIGNYGWTPLGIHTDGIGENVMHFHLGPGEKIMYTWDKGIYEDLVEASARFNNTNIEEILYKANKFAFKEGDIYFMPHGEYHVGKSDELSVGLTLWFNNHTESSLAKKLADNVVSNIFHESNEILAMDKSSYDDLTNFEDIKKLFTVEAENQSFLDLLKMAYKDYKFALYSNAGFWEAPFPKAEKINHTLDYNIRIIVPFKILFYTDDHLNLFIRGKKISLINNSTVNVLIEKLNNNEILSKSSVFRILEKSWNDEIKQYILDLLFENHVIEVTYV